MDSTKKAFDELPENGSKMNPDSTLRALGPMLLVGQIFGLLPMSNVTSYPRGANALSFKWWSIRSLFAATLIGFSTVQLALSCRRMAVLGMSLGGLTAIIFFFVTTCTAVLMFKLSANGHWKRLMMEFERTEELFAEDSYPIPKWTLRRKIGTLSTIVICTSLVEHSFFIMAKLTNVLAQIEKCHFKVFFYEHFIRTEKRHLYAVISFNFFIAIPFEITNTCNTIAWTFLDLFIMVYSISLAHRFEQISRRIHGILMKRMSDDFWAEVREHFVTMQELVESVDHRFSYLILLSCGTDVYFTCFLLFNSFGNFPEILNALYFYFSISYIITRTLLTLYFATTVHEAGRRPLILLRSIPHDAWGPEVGRFAYQMSNETVALSGKQFFYFTRKVILTLIGTIITYELVILDHIIEQPEVVQKTCEVAYNITE